ncbi:MAG: S8 family serine peptidase [Thermoanaerobaculales bacterium]|nr:S8 family serine peptidase [Thermoanaerobaculales bacterium]
MRHLFRAVSVISILILSTGFLEAEQNRSPVDQHGHGEYDSILEKAPLTKLEPVFEKMDSGLNQIASSPTPFQWADDLGYQIRDSRVQVVAATLDGASQDVEAWLLKRDATFVSSARNTVQAFVPIGVLTELAGLEQVNYVRKPTYGRPNTEPDESRSPKILGYTTEGLAPMNASSWHSAGYSGQGFKVGLVAFGFSGYQSLLGSELPPANRVHYQSFSGWQSSNGFGTAEAEIIHDVAPGVELYLAEIQTSIDASNAFEWMRSNGVDVIVSDLFLYPESPGDGTGLMADLASDLHSEGIFLVSVAGDFRQNHWQGRWIDPDGDGWMNFTEGDEVNHMTDGHDRFWSPPGVDLFAALVWDEWDNPITDLDFCAVVDYNDGTGLHVLACAEDVQNGGPGQLPREISEFTTPSYGYYSFAIWRASGSRSPDMEVYLYRLDAIPEYRNPEGSLVSPSDVQEVVAVGAVDALSNSLETYSSKGPTNGPGGSLSGGQTKPDLAGYSMVSTYTYGTRALYGTGPAAMHVAGAAALVWSANPTWSNSQVRSYLESNAIDMGPGGKDNDYGHGRLYLGDPPQSCTYSISPTSRNFASGGGSGTINVSTQSGCSWTASESISWVSITSGSSGSGNGTVNFSVSSNTSASSRSGTIQVAGKTFSITQDGATSCSYSISPTSNSFGASGGTETVSVTTTSGCSWTATSNAGWMTVTSGSSGTGSGTVGYNVAANTSANQRSGSITIAGKTFSVTQSGAAGGDSESYLVAGMAHAGGAGGSVWRSTLAVTNLFGATANLTLVYRYGSGSSTRSHTLQNGRIVEWLDVATSLFGVGGDSAGSIEVLSTSPVIVTARTYNEGADGTFGQFLPGVDDGNKMEDGQIGILPQVKKTPDFRTNIGFVNLGQSSVTVRTKLYSSNGGQLGNTVTTSMPANQWKQDNDIFQKAGVSFCEVGYATVEVTTSGGSVWAYASVVDNGTGDPTTIPVFVQ